MITKTSKSYIVISSHADRFYNRGNNTGICDDPGQVSGEKGCVAK